MGEGKEFTAGPGNKKDNDAMGASPHEIADVAVGKTDESEEDAEGDELRSPPFRAHERG